MPKLRPEDLDKIGEKIRRTTFVREGTARVKVVVHMGTCGIAAGARAIMMTLMEEIKARDVKDVLLTTASCAGLCSHEPMITIESKDEPPVKYIDLTSEKVKKVLEEHVIGGKIVTEYALALGSERVA